MRELQASQISLPSSQTLGRKNLKAYTNAVELVLCSRDYWFFLTNAVYTLDQHDKENPIKRFPDKEYLKALSDLWFKESLLLVPKSRQMIITWLFVGLYLWEAMFHTGRLIFFQSKKEEDAVGDENSGTGPLGRAKFIYSHLAPQLKSRAEITYNKIKFLDTNSTIWAIPQGGDVIRQHTPSGILSDEMAFQFEAEKGFIAAKPALDKGARFTGVSSANPGYFQLLVEDERS